MDKGLCLLIESLAFLLLSLALTSILAYKDFGMGLKTLVRLKTTYIGRALSLRRMGKILECP